jgi:hypothetical protein
VKAEAAKCDWCIPDTGPRAQEFGPSSAQENARQKKGDLLNATWTGKRADPYRGVELGTDGNWIAVCEAYGREALDEDYRTISSKDASGHAPVSWRYVAIACGSVMLAIKSTTARIRSECELHRSNCSL